MSEFQLREGMFCRDAKGQKVGPMSPWMDGWWHYGSPESPLWDERGVPFLDAPALISEWQDDTPAADEWSEWMTREEANKYVGGYWGDGDRMARMIGGVHQCKVPVSRKAVKRETRQLTGRGYVFAPSGTGNDTHRITFDLVNGVPDCSTIKMDEL